MFAELSVENGNTDDCHTIKKKGQKQVLVFTKFDVEKENIDDYCCKYIEVN